MSSGFPSTSPIFYFKLSYVSHFSVVTQKKIRHYCNDLNIKLVFSSFEIDDLFGVKDPIPGRLRHGSRVVLRVRAVMPVMSAKQPGIFPHACVSTWSVIRPLTFSNTYGIHCRTLCSVGYFRILDHASTSFHLKVKEALH